MLFHASIAAHEPASVRPAMPADADECGRICFDAFQSIASRHGFANDFPDSAAAAGLFRDILQLPAVQMIVAEHAGRILGSNVGWLRPPVAGIGPITVDPSVQDTGVGRQLMQHILAMADEAGCRSVRLVQAAYHGRSLALYTRLGFDAVEPLSCLQGPPINMAIADTVVRKATSDDRAACLELAETLHGFARDGEFDAAVQAGTAQVVLRDGRVAGYCTGIGFFSHAVARSNEDLAALISAATAISGPGLLLPTRNSELLRWCLDHGLRIVQPMTLMSRGSYREPAGAWLPSVIF